LSNRAAGAANMPLDRVQVRESSLTCFKPDGAGKAPSLMQVGPPHLNLVLVTPSHAHARVTIDRGD
jgi:hypothetical protein